MTALRECPFECGASMPPVTTHVSHDAYATMCSCGAQGPHKPTRVEAETEWNRRAPVVTREEIAVVLCDWFTNSGGGMVYAEGSPDDITIDGSFDLSDAADKILALLRGSA